MGLLIHNHFIDKLAFLNGVISGIALYPQVYSIMTGSGSTGLSLTTFIIIFINSIVWLLYSIHRNLLSLGLASLLNCIASGIVVVLIILNY